VRYIGFSTAHDWGVENISQIWINLGVNPAVNDHHKIKFSQALVAVCMVFFAAICPLESPY